MLSELLSHPPVDPVNERNSCEDEASRKKFMADPESSGEENCTQQKIYGLNFFRLVVAVEDVLKGKREKKEIFTQTASCRVNAAAPRYRIAHKRG